MFKLIMYHEDESISVLETTKSREEAEYAMAERVIDNPEDLLNLEIVEVK